MQDRRKAKRVSLDAMLFCTLSVQGGRKVEAMITDVSHDGLRLGFPSVEDTDILHPGDEVVFVDSPEEAAALEGFAVSVVWVMDGACGVAFPEGGPMPRELLPTMARRKR